MRKDTIYLWVDGSASLKTGNIYGLGALVVTKEAVTELTHKVRATFAKSDPRRMAIYAECLATIFALRSQPEGSKIVLNTDRLEICSLIRKDDFHRAAERDNDDLKKLYDLIRQEVKRHQKVEVHHRMYDFNPEMKKAHNLADGVRRRKGKPVEFSFA